MSADLGKKDYVCVWKNVFFTFGPLLINLQTPICENTTGYLEIFVAH